MIHSLGLKWHQIALITLSITNLALIQRKEICRRIWLSKISSSNTTIQAAKSTPWWWMIMSRWTCRSRKHPPREEDQELHQRDSLWTQELSQPVWARSHNMTRRSRFRRKKSSSTHLPRMWSMRQSIRLLSSQESRPLVFLNASAVNARIQNVWNCTVNALETKLLVVPNVNATKTKEPNSHVKTTTSSKRKEKKPSARFLKVEEMLLIIKLKARSISKDASVPRVIVRKSIVNALREMWLAQATASVVSARMGSHVDHTEVIDQVRWQHSLLSRKRAPTSLRSLCLLRQLALCHPAWWSLKTHHQPLHQGSTRDSLS